MRTNDRGIVVPDVLMNPLPWKVERGEMITDRAGCLVYQDKDSTQDTLHFTAVAANYHERMADIVRRLEVWNAAENTMEDGLWDIVNDATTLWAEYQETVK